MPDDKEDEREQMESTLFLELEEAKRALMEAVSALNASGDSPPAMAAARERCQLAYEKYNAALERFSTWVLGPKSGESS